MLSSWFMIPCSPRRQEGGLFRPYEDGVIGLTETGPELGVRNLRSAPHFRVQRWFVRPAAIASTSIRISHALFYPLRCKMLNIKPFIWRFPEIGVPPNHPFDCDFPWTKPSGYWGYPHFNGNLHMGSQSTNLPRGAPLEGGVDASRPQRRVVAHGISWHSTQKNRS